MQSSFITRKKIIILSSLIILFGGYYLAWRVITRKIVDEISQTDFFDFLKTGDITISGFPFNTNFHFSFGNEAPQKLTERLTFKTDPADITIKCDILMKSCDWYTHGTLSHYILDNNNPDFNITLKFDHAVNHYKFGRGLVLDFLMNKKFDDFESYSDEFKGTVLFKGKEILNVVGGKSFFKLLQQDKKWLFTLNGPFTYSMPKAPSINHVVDFEIKASEAFDEFNININDLAIRSAGSEISLRGNIDLSAKTGLNSINLTYKADAFLAFGGIIESWMSNFITIDKTMKDSIAQSLNKIYLAQLPYSQSTDPKNILVNISGDKTKDLNIQVGATVIPNALIVANASIIEAFKIFPEAYENAQKKLKKVEKN